MGFPLPFRRAPLPLHKNCQKLWASKATAQPNANRRPVDPWPHAYTSPRVRPPLHEPCGLWRKLASHPQPHRT